MTIPKSYDFISLAKITIISFTLDEVVCNKKVAFEKQPSYLLSVKTRPTRANPRPILFLKKALLP